MAYVLRSSTDYASGGEPARNDPANMQIIAESRPYRWMSGYVGRKGAIPRDLMTQRPYIGIHPPHPVTISTPSNLGGREAVDFSGSVFCGLKDAAKFPPTFRSFSFLLRFQVMGELKSANGLFFQEWSQSVATGFALVLNGFNLYVFFSHMSGDFVSVSPAGGTPPPVGTVTTLAGTYDNTSKSLKLYQNDMSVAAASATTAGNSIVPGIDGDLNLYIGAPTPGIGRAAPIAIGDFLLWNRALTAVELIAINDASRALSGL